MHCHVAAEALLRCGHSGSICCSSRSNRFSRFFCRCSFFVLFSRRHNAVDRLQRSFGGDRRTGQCFDSVFAVGEGAALANELIGERRFGSPLAQAVGFIGRIDGQRLDLVAVQGDVYCHVAAEALLRCGDGILIRRSRFRFLGRFFRGGFFGRFLTGDGLVDRLQGSRGSHGSTGQGFNAVFTEGEGTVLADELVSEFRVRRALAQAFGLVRRIDGQFLDRVALQDKMRRNVAAKALHGCFRFRLTGSQFLGGRVILQGFGSAEHTGHRQDDRRHQHRADCDPDPLFLSKIVHFLPSINSEWS